MHTMTRSGLAVVAALAAGNLALAADWPNWRGPDLNGISKETDWDPARLAKREVAWEAKVGMGYSAVAVANGKVYTTGNFNKDTDRIVCFDEATGKELWKHEYPEPLDPKYYSGGSSGTPTVHAGKVYYASKKGKVFCLDAATGKVVWQKEFGTKVPTWGFASSGLVHGKAVIFNAGSAGISYDLETGKVLWSSGDEEAGYATPVPFQQRGKAMLAMFGKNSVMAVDPANGKVAWSHPWKTQHDVNAADPIISGDRMFITSGYNHGCALLDISGSKPKELWKNRNMRSQMSGPVLIDGHLYGFDDAQLVCLEWTTGETKWKEKQPRKGALMAAGDKLIIMGENGRLAIADVSPEGYREIAATDTVKGRYWTMPILANGRIYTRSSDGDLLCLKVGK